MRLLPGHFRRRLTAFAYLCVSIWLITYFTTSGRFRRSPPTEEQREVSDAEILSNAWQLNANGKLVVPLDNQGDSVRLNITDSAHVRHPLYHLIRDAEKKWNALLDRQSKTLQEAVAEYQRRYQRLPPKGFDQWYDFAVKRGVILMDEYDQIDRDLVPFLALSPETAQKLRDVLSEQDPMWFVGAAIKDGVAELHDDREIRRGIHRLTPSFEHLLPDMNWYTHLHDMSPYTIDQELRDEAKEALLSGTYMDLETVKQFENPNRNTRRGVLKGCLEDAPSVIQEIDLTLKTTPHVQTRSSFEFIHTLHTTMDICHNQALFDNQCLFSGTHPRDARLRPLFIQSKTVHGGGIMTPTEYGFGEHDDKLDTPWSQRSPRVYWRGTNTGNCPPNHLRNSPRVRLHMMAQDNPLMSSDDTVHILVEDFTEEDDEEDTHEAGGGLRVEEVSMKKFNAEFMDVGLVGPPIQCGDKDNCALMEKEIGFLPRVSRGSRGEGNKYTIDVDGNGWSGRFRGLLGGGSVVFKFTNFPEWNTDRMMPYYHYVPIQHDFSDLYNSVAFFTGTPEGKGAHDKMAERIGANAVDYVRKHWRWQDMEVYVYRLLLEYARVMSSDRDAMTYQPAPPPARPL